MSRIRWAALAVMSCIAAAGSAQAAPGDFQWNRGWDATGFADTDDVGATGASGMWFGAINFGGGAQNSGNPFTGDVWVSRYDPNGVFLWNRTFTPAGMGVTVTAVTCAPNGHIYVAGTIINNGMIDFGGGNLGGNGQMWIVKFDELGNYLWSDTFGLGTIHSLDGDQNLLGIGGQFFGAIDFGGGAINPVGGLDAFLALLHGGAAHIWSAGYGDVNEQITRDVDVDVSGTMVAVGSFQGMIDFGGGNLLSNAAPDLFVAKFDPAGAHVWSENYLGPFGLGADIVVAIAQNEGAERIALAGTVQNGPVDFGGGVLAPFGGSDVFLVMLDELGALDWSKRYGSPIDDQGQDVAFDLGGNVIATGAFQQNIAFSATAGALISNGGVDLFVSSWNYLGTHAWNRGYGTVNDDVRCRVSTDPTGEALLFGTADNFINFGGGMLPNADIFLTKVKALNAPVDAPVVAAAPASSAAFSPNPFTASSEIRFDVPRTQRVAVSLHDVNGRRVRQLASGERAAGASSLAWDGRDEAGRPVPAGVYFWRIEGADLSASGRVTRVR